MKKILLLSIFGFLLLAVVGCNRFNITTTTTNTEETTTTSRTTTSEGQTTTWGSKVTISYWNSLTGADGVVMRQLVQLFNEEYQGRIEVTEVYTNEVDYYTNLNILVPMGRGPDVAIMHSYLVQSYANRELIIPIENYINSSGVDIQTEDYIQDVIQSLYFDDMLYGIPLDIHTVGIYYNVDLLNKYSLAVPTNRQELLHAAKTVQAGEKAAGRNNFWGLPLSSVWPSEWIFTTSLYQNNGLEIDSEGNPMFYTDAGKTALKAVTDLVHVENLSPINLGVDQDLFYFQTGQALFHIQGSWMLNSMIESGINFGVIPLSHMFNSDQASYSEKIHARSHTFVIPMQTRTVSDIKKLAIMLFVKYLGDHSYVWATAGQIPASNIARATTEYQSLPYLNGFGAVENFRVSARSPYFHEAYSPVYSRVTAALLNSNYNADTLLSAALEEALQLIQAAKGQ